MTAAWMMPLMRAAGVRDPAESRLLYRLRLLRRRFLGLNTKIINDYLRATDEPKLHIGGGWHLIEGWLNTDIALISGVMHMDATRSFPLGRRRSNSSLRSTWLNTSPIGSLSRCFASVAASCATVG